LIVSIVDVHIVKKIKDNGHRVSDRLQPQSSMQTRTSSEHTIVGPFATRMNDATMTLRHWH
jgi:hypothetical protein